MVTTSDYKILQNQQYMIFFFLPVELDSIPARDYGSEELATLTTCACVGTERQQSTAQSVSAGPLCHRDIVYYPLRPTQIVYYPLRPTQIVYYPLRPTQIVYYPLRGHRTLCTTPYVLHKHQNSGFCEYH